MCKHGGCAALRTTDSSDSHSLKWAVDSSGEHSVEFFRLCRMSLHVRYQVVCLKHLLCPLHVADKRALTSRWRIEFNANGGCGKEDEWVGGGSAGYEGNRAHGHRTFVEVDVEGGTPKCSDGGGGGGGGGGVCVCVWGGGCCITPNHNS
jgi:hypothetical protein